MEDEGDLAQQQCDYFWAIMINAEHSYQPRIVEVAKKQFSQLISESKVEDMVEKYLGHCITNIKQGKAVLSCISIIEKIVEQLPQFESVVE